MDVSVQLTAVRQGMPSQFFDQNCPTRVILDHVMSKWGVLLLCTLADRTLRWSELRRAVEGVSEKMLAQTLQTLERDGLVLREARPVVPPHVEYSLTELGQGLVVHLLPLMGWLQANAPAMIGAGPDPRVAVGSDPRVSVGSGSGPGVS